jgi:hypothetical protein
VKEFWVYTGLRIGLFFVCYAVFAGIWVLVVGGSQGSVLWPFVIAVLVSSVLSLKLLSRQREAFARRVQERAARASERFEEMRSKEDAD